MKKLQYNSPVILSFFFLSLAALVLDYLTGGVTTAALFSVYRAPLTSPLTYVRLVGHVLGHAGWEHFLGNMLLLLVVGPPIEEKYGSRMLLEAIVLTALASGLLQFVLFPDSALLGASGIVFMMIVLSSFTESRGGGIPITLILVVIFYLGGEIIDGIRNTDSVSQLTHVVGGVLGMIFGFLYRGGRRR